MKRKRGEKKRHVVVAWISKAEWDQVREHLYSSDSSLQERALDRISVWTCRSTRNTPVAVELTADLVRCQVSDRGGQTETLLLELMYGMALTRFVNLITERQQGRVARSLRLLAGKLKIPEWVVDLRHGFTHGSRPSLSWCRKGCAAALDWLQQRYWSRQLAGGDWSPDSDEDEEDDGKDEAARQKEIEAYKKVRELLISYETEQYQVVEGGSEAKEKWPAPFAEMSWILAEIKQWSLDSCELLVDVLLEDGFLVPTQQQLDTLGCGSFHAADANPQIPQSFLRFWLPLLRALNSLSFIHLLLEKLFAELKLLRSEPNDHRAFFVSAWISEVVLCNARPDSRVETKGQRRARLKDRIFVNRVPLRWQQLLAACMDAPCASSPRLLQLVLKDMEHPLPLETQENMLRLCSIYTQNQRPSPSSPSSPSPRKHQPVYTLESLHEKLLRSRSRHRRSRELDRGGSMLERGGGSIRELSDGDAEKVRLLRGSPWQLCTEHIPWRNYPLGRVPGQTDDPDCLTLDNYTLTAFPEQPLETEALHLHRAAAAANANAKSDGLLWSPSEVARIKSGIKLF